MRFERETVWREFKNRFVGSVTQDQVDGLEFLLESFERDGIWSDIRHVAYALATIWHETAYTFQPIDEYGSNAYFNRRYGPHRRVGKRLGNTREGDGAKFKGRGYVQLTGRSNYTKLTKILNDQNRELGGVDLVGNPKQAKDPEIAFLIMTIGMFRGIYTGKSFSSYINASKTDYLNARRIINGTDKASRIAQHAKHFESILRKAYSEQVEEFTDPTFIEIEEPEIVEPEPVAPVEEQEPVKEAEPLEPKTVVAPEKEHSTKKSAQMTIAGIAVPSFLVGLFKAGQDAIEKGWVDMAAVFGAVGDFIQHNMGYAFGLIGLMIGLLAIKKLSRQITLWVKMWIKSDPKRHDTDVIPQ